MTRIRSVDEFLDPKHGFNPTPAERALIAACRAGEKCRLGDGTRPEEDSEARRVRAELIRLLILGGTEACGLDGSGVFLFGAFVSGHLEIHSAARLNSLVLVNTLFEKHMDLQGSNIEFLSLEGSAVPCVFLGEAHVNKNVILRNFHGWMVDLTGAKIGGGFSLEHAELVSDSEYALRGQRITVGQDMNFTELSAIGMLDITGANVEGQLSCASAKLEVGAGPALRAQSAYFRHGLFLNEAEVIGSVDISGAHIGGQLGCENIKIDNHDGLAMNAQSISVDKEVTFNLAKIRGTVDICGAVIGGQLSFKSADIVGQGDIAISGQHLAVKKTVYLTKLKTSGSVDFSSANISGSLDLSSVSIAPTGDWALFARNINVSGDFIFKDVREIGGIVSLEAAHVGELYDSKETWSKVSGTVSINGFTYDRLSGDSNIEMRLSWLERGSRVKGYFFPQPYTQLAKVYTNMGHNRLARRVLFERECILAAERKRADQMRLNHLWCETRGDRSHKSQAMRGDIGVQWLRLRFWQAISAISRRLVGYGYRPQLALFWALGAILFSTVLYFIAYRTGAMVPDSPVVLTSTDWLEAMKSDAVRTTLVWQNTPSAMHYETFNAGAFATDVFLPIIELGQDSAWAPTTTTTLGCIVWAYTWAVQLFGWLVSALGVAAITGIMQRDRD